MVAVSSDMQKYFQELQRKAEEAFKVAEKARKKGYDPEKNVEIHIANTLAERVVGLLSVLVPQIKGTKIPERIKELEQQYGSLDWRVALKIAEEVAKEKFCKFKDQKEAIETGIRVGFAYITLGVVSSPIEGFLGIDLVDRMDGKGKYFRVNYAGPVRSAGGTAAAVSVIIADYLRRVFGFAPYDPTEQEIKRTYIELEDYHNRVTNLQYFPSKEETLFLASHLPVQIGGDPSEKVEVSNYKDLPRVPTNRVRNGFCLVMAECLALKAPKLLKQIKKWGKDFGLDDWLFLEKFVEIQKKSRAKKQAKQEGITPDYAFIKDLVAGRPVLSHPMRDGGLRIRLGRSRVSGYSGQSMHPATMQMFEGFIAIGTQLKTERPGKATSVTPCDTIEGPIVKLSDGSVKYLDSDTEAKRLLKDIEEVLYLGDILVSYGDFSNRNHVLVPLGYVEEWWIQEFEEALSKTFGGFRIDELADILGVDKDKLLELFRDPLRVYPDPLLAVNLSRALPLPLHPKYTFYWKNRSKQDLLLLLEWFRNANIVRNDYIEKIILPLKGFEKNKRVLELLGVPHLVSNNEFVVIEKHYAHPLFYSLGLDKYSVEELIEKVNELEGNALDIVNSVSSLIIRDKAGTFMGARMGRPEKAKLRKLDGSPNGLIPVGEEGGRMRSLNTALEARAITADFRIYYCPKCKKEVLLPRCEYCGSETIKMNYCPKEGLREHCENGKPYRRKTIDPTDMINATLKLTNEKLPQLVKGVRGTSNADHTFEHPAKPILRAKHSLTVNKDGTIRYDASEVVVTHFKPKEIGTSIEKLRELGYTHDIYGNPLVNEDQILEIKPQDVILPASPASPDEPSDEVFFRVASFIDDLLVKLYKEKPFYDAYSKKDLVGQLVLVLAPHTSAGVVARIIGFSKTQGLMAHPMLHAGIRRDVDGDEAGVMLLLDAFLNFSRHYLPASRGSTQDAPLVVTTMLNPAEVDDMLFDVDIVDHYPLELYRAAQELKPPSEVAILQVKDVLGTEKQYEGYLFTHDTTDFNKGVLCSAYKLLPSMQEKLEGQMRIAKRIRAVDERDVAKLVIDKHFLKDIKGNLRKFSIQEFRCVNCNTKYRRPPLHGKCEKCGGRIIFTISEGSVIKYLDYTLKLAEEYDASPYIKESLYILKERIEEVFGKEKEKQLGLEAFR